jgi:L-fuconolactonase
MTSNRLTRRALLAAAAAPVAAPVAHAATPIPIIDTHIHLFDPTRPQGVPWPPKDDAVRYKKALPDRFIQLTKDLGVVGAIEVEASPWPEDNQWVHDVAAPFPVILGHIGNLDPAGAGFCAELERLARNPIFRGIRYGNLWPGHDLGNGLAKPDFVKGLRDLAAAQLVLDSANPNLKLLADIRRLSDLVPTLRIVVDHLPGMAAPKDATEQATYEELLRDLAGRKQIYFKVSAVLKRPGGKLETKHAFYKPKLDEMWQRFGEDRLLFGSDWPNSDGLGTYDQVLAVVREYFTAKGPGPAAKYFYKNSKAAYRWQPRNDAQKKLG